MNVNPEVVRGYQRRIRDLEEALAFALAENDALHQMIKEFRDELNATETQLNLMMRDRTYVV